MAYLNIEVWDVSGAKKNVVEVPNDVHVNRIITLLVERLNMPRYNPDGQLLSYKFHHQRTQKQLLDEQTLEEALVQEGDVLRLQPEIIAGSGRGPQPQTVAIRDPDREDRFARFRLIGWWEQSRLQAAKVLVIGAGALGNEILKNLALLGVGQVFVADLDDIENSNLSRSVLFREKDNGAGKAEVAARAMKDIYPHLKVQWLKGNVLFDLGLGVYHWADVVLAGLDNREARLEVNRQCWKTNTPWIDGAIEQLNGVVRVFVPPDGACYECTMGKVDWEILEARRACNLLTREEMLEGKVPTTPTSAAIIAGMQCQEAVKLLHGLEVLESQGFIFNGLTHDSYTIAYPRKANCFSHETYAPIRKTKRSAATTTFRELLAEVRAELGQDAIIEFNHDIIEALECQDCQQREELYTCLGRVSAQAGKCSRCGQDRAVKTIHSINGSEPFLDKTFTEIGLPPFDIVVGRRHLEQIFLWFDQDAPQVLGELYEGGVAA